MSEKASTRMKPSFQERNTGRYTHGDNVAKDGASERAVLIIYKDFYYFIDVVVVVVCLIARITARS